MNSKCQIDLIDMQTQHDGRLEFILVYHNRLIEFVLLRPLKIDVQKESLVYYSIFSLLFECFLFYRGTMAVNLRTK